MLMRSTQNVYLSIFSEKISNFRKSVYLSILAEKYRISTKMFVFFVFWWKNIEFSGNTIEIDRFDAVQAVQKQP